MSVAPSGQAALAASASVAEPPASDDSALSASRPFPGLRPFGFADRAFFFGRERQVFALYRLVENGRQTFDIATKHIYDPPPTDWTGRFELLLIGNAEDRDASREALRNAGFGSPVPGVWVAPSGAPIPLEAKRGIRLEVSAEDDSGRRLLAESWPLDRTANAYLKFMKTFEPLHGWVERRERLSDADAFTARILLIHYYRRVVLRDPLLPTALLPKDWPGMAARFIVLR